MTGVLIPITFTVQDKGLNQALAKTEASAYKAAVAITGIGGPAALRVLGQLGKELENTSEHLHKFRRGVEETIEQLFLLGTTGTNLVNVIEDVADPIKRLELGQAALRGETGALAGSLTNITQGFAIAKAKATIWAGSVENLALLTGGLGLAVGAVTVGLGTLGSTLVKVASAGLKAYIAGTKEAAKVQADLEVTIARTEQRLGEVLYKYGEVERLSRSAEVGVALLDGTMGRVNGTTKLLDESLTALAAVLAPLQPALVGQVANFQSFTLVAEKAYKGVSQATDQLQIFERVMRSVDAASKGAAAGGMSTFTIAVNTQADSLTFLQTALRGVSSLLDDVARKASAATPYLTGLEAGEATGASQARAGLRRGTGGARRFQTFSGAAGSITGAAGQFGGAGARSAAGQARGSFGVLGLGEGPDTLDVRRRLEAAALGLETASGGGAAERTKQQAGANVADRISEINRATEAYKSLGIAINDASAATGQMAGSLADVAAAFGQQTLKAKDFGKVMRAAAGALFQDLGKGFVLQGTARLLAGDIIGGPALIGAGLALSFYGGKLVRGTAIGGGGASAGASSTAASASRASPALQRERERERPIILRVGERDIRGVITDMATDGQRRGMGGRTR